jgi:hypothetical protein
LTIAGLTLVLFLSGCSGCGNRPGKFQAKLVHAIEKKCQPELPCTIRLKDVTDFSWDKMYAFMDSADQLTMERVLGTKAAKVGDGTTVVFMNNGKVVLSETEPWELDKRLPNDVAFDNFPDNKYYRAYGPDAEFTVKRIEMNNGVAYDLTLIRQPGAPR